MRVIIAGGGTGGHLFPGLAVAEEFKNRDRKTEIIFVGTEHGIEAKVVPREGYPIKFLRAEGMVGVSFKRKIKAIAKMIMSVKDSYKIIQDVKPDVMIGVGGYTSGVIMLIASLISIPTIIIEQNCIPGLTNRILGKFVKTVCITYQESIPYFPKGKTYLTGNPVRMNILRGSAESGYELFSLDKNLFTIFIFGGSLGARSINNAVIESLIHLQDLKKDIQFLHQTGKEDYERVRCAYRDLGFKGTVAPFIFEMGEAYAVSDLVISRAGATTLAEITALGKPAILIPYPYATGHHQELNAMKLLEMGAAKVIKPGELSGESISKTIRILYENEAMRLEMQKNSRALGKLDASVRVVDIAMSILKNKGEKSNSGR
jgi:UDP-N-acetylglucosamine--N-acetylmuramyl-(pentapeptide) pyrophosphoryl-undecaprenol N-acetylglucosamine transferase